MGSSSEENLLCLADNTWGHSPESPVLQAQGLRGALIAELAREPQEARAAVQRLTIGWLLNLILYGAAASGAYLIAHYRLDNPQTTIGFPTRATMALLWNLCATEPLGALVFAAVIRYRNDRRRRKQL